MEGGRIVAERTAVAHFAGHRQATANIPDPIRAETVVEAQRLSKTFPIRGSRALIHAVDNVDLTIAKGETLGLVGESGSGKTTAGRALIRLVAPDAGEVRIAGGEIGRLDRARLRALRRQMQLVRQDPFGSFDPRWTVLRSVIEPLAAHGIADAKGRDARAREVLALVGCEELADRRPADCSAGALQRIAIARAIATEPTFVVLDEPTSVLDPASREDLVALLGKLQQETGTAFLFISHDLTTVAAISHRVAVMYLGQIVEMGTTRAVFESPRHPYTRALIAAHLDVDPARRRIDHPATERLDGEIPSPIDLPPGCYLASRCPHVLPRCEGERQSLVADIDGAIRCWRAAAAELPPFVRRAA